MNEVTEGAAVISTYGLYAIVSALAICVIYLYKRTMTLEKEFRDYISKTSNEVSVLQKELITQTTEALNASSKTITDATEALNRIVSVLEGRHG
jgi:hypothetical protein